jgi:predicted nucleic acid-binding protein
VKDDRILIDTSVWIDYFKNRSSRLSEKVDEILTFSSVFVPKVVIAELMQGAKTENEISVIEEFIGAFNIVDHTENTWIKAGRLSFSMKKRGLTVNLIDCYIALLANENNCKIFSLDEHFKSIKNFIKIELVI